MNFKTKLQRFMYGRYGVDELYNFLLGLCFVIIILNLFINFRPLVFIELFILIILTYRCLSKKIYSRSNENQIYLKIRKRFFKPLSNLKRNYLDRKDYVYCRCHHCKTTLKLRLPNKRGINHIKCPNCKKRITCFCLRKQKVIVIKNK